MDPSLGTNADLASLTKKLRKAGISLCLDFVMNHTASSHRWAKAAQAGDPKYQDYYYCHDDRTIPDQYDAVVPEVFPATAPGNFTWDDDINGWVWTTFNSYQWDLNWANPDVFAEFADLLLFLAAFWILIPIAIWIYALVFAFSALWFAHFCLAALEQMRAQAMPSAADPQVPFAPGADDSGGAASVAR